MNVAKVATHLSIYDRRRGRGGVFYTGSESQRRRDEGKSWTVGESVLPTYGRWTRQRCQILGGKLNKLFRLFLLPGT